MKLTKKIAEESEQRSSEKKKENVFDNRARELAKQIINMAKESHMQELQHVSAKDAKAFELEVQKVLEKGLRDFVEKHFYVIGFPMVSNLKIKPLGEKENFKYTVSFNIRIMPLPSIADGPGEQKLIRDLLNEPELSFNVKVLKK